MPKVEINQVAEAAKSIQLEPKQLRELIEKLNMITENAEDKPPAIKKQFIILISDPDGLLPKNDFAGWVLQIPEEASPALTQERIHQAVYAYNASRKGRLYPAKTIGDALENIAGHFFKDADVWVKTKTPVLMLRTDNALPDDRQEKFDYRKEGAA